MSFARLERVWRSSTLRLTLLTTALIWFTCATLVLVLHHLLVEALVEYAEQDIDALVDERLATWNQIRGWEPSVSDWLYRKLSAEIAVLNDCVALRYADGERALGNFNEDDVALWMSSGHQVVKFGGGAWQRERGDNPEVCLVKDYPLADGGRLSYGIGFDSELANILRLRQLRYWGLLIVGIVALSIGWVVSYRAYKGIQRINRVCDQVASGNLALRIAPSGRDDDFDHLSLAINHMLDQIAQLMLGVKQVSDAIAHDLKTPLARLRGRLELLLEQPERDDASIHAVIAETDRILAAFNALLRISQLEQGSQRQAFKAFDMRDVVDRALDLYALVLEDRAVALVLELTGEACPVYGDPELWLQALCNLIDNAAKYTPGGGRVTLRLGCDDEQVRFSIEDSGPGIPPAEQHKVFERFYRMERHRSLTGTGLGLSLVSAVCKLHHAEIALENRPGLWVEVRLRRHHA
ncbi:MAG TPA: HAMP domain-containing sensor histidine kinase [Spongiibacteraceae bacterium]|jgi:signal transduction histidine kinase|nr:HAMP domain-containing sensor histidine kinase [Spongiibacteraceae bacterium]HUH36725.1 HAMP domain-containing sensor histidine kinase [Spongiibacteraceae bacterium]